MAAPRFLLLALTCTVTCAHALDVCLFQTRQASLKKKAHKSHQARKRKRLHRRSKQQPAGWFGGFPESESTFDEDGWEENPGDPELATKDGWDVGTIDGAAPSGVVPHGPKLPSVWFEESKSGGPHEAWQTNYPALEGGEGGNSAPPWRQSSNGAWHQHYKPSGTMGRATSSKAKPADWFDTIVDEYDSYGRRLQPDQLAAAQAVGWAKVEKTAQIACAAPGCEAAASVTMFNGEYEQAKNCKFTFKVHATDFDDDFSDERVEYVKINGGIVNSMCNPGTSGCNATAGVALYPCVTDVDLTQIIATNNGTLAISAKISKMVDECPFEGFMLNGIATTTCYVTGKKSALPTTPPPLVAVPSPSLNLLGTHAQCALQCGAPNCTASCTILLDATAIIGTTCKMTIVVNNTDFDGELGSLEVIDFISVDGKEISVDASPGKNPCKAEQEGHPLPPDELSYSPMQEQDVTAYAMGGSMTVAAKISEMVDECPSNGFLLDGMAYVVCT